MSITINSIPSSLPALKTMAEPPTQVVVEKNMLRITYDLHGDYYGMSLVRFPQDGCGLPRCNATVFLKISDLVGDIEQYFAA